MEFRELIAKRVSVRKYTQQPVEEHKLQLLLEAAQAAPTAANRQPFRLIVIREPQNRARMKEVYDREWFYTAPVIIAAVGVPAENWVRKDGKNYNDVDVAIVMDHLILQAAELGLGTCWIADFDAEAARRLLELPTGVEPIVVTPVGYPADEGRPKKRKSLEELVLEERFG